MSTGSAQPLIPFIGGVMFAGTSDYTDFLFLTSEKKNKKKKSGFREPAGNTIHSCMCHNRCAQLQIKQYLLVLSGTRMSASALHLGQGESFPPRELLLHSDPAAADSMFSS